MGQKEIPKNISFDLLIFYANKCFHFPLQENLYILLLNTFRLGMLKFGAFYR